MSDETRRCLNCGGVFQGPLPKGASACGAAVPDIPEARGLKRTKCSAVRVRTATAKCSICGGTDGISKEFRPELDSVVLCWTCSSGRVTVKSFRSRVAELLRRIEWSADDGEQERGSPCCPVCRAVEAVAWMKVPTPHAPDCALAALLKEVER